MSILHLVAMFSFYCFICYIKSIFSSENIQKVVKITDHWMTAAVDFQNSFKGRLYKKLVKFRRLNIISEDYEGKKLNILCYI